MTDATASTVTMYSTPWCGYCRRLKRQMDDAGVAYVEVDIEQVPEAAAIVEQVNHGNQTVPTLVYSDGTSQTILMGEVLEGTWSQGNDCCVRTTLDRFIGKPLNVNGRQAWIYWASKHPNLVNFAKCDGSVSTISFQIQRPVLVALMTRAGGEAISDDQMR